MDRCTLTRWITAPLLAMSVVVQSFASALPAPCHCATAEESVCGSRSCGCCSQEAREQKCCCCSKKTCCFQRQSCCPAKTAGMECHCGCSQRQHEPVAPVPSSQSEVSWESLFAECDQTTIEPTAKPGLRIAASGNRVLIDASAPSVQVLCCIWLT